jgi:predicted flap endonuclease-1-like 5' DNA nuclease
MGLLDTIRSILGLGGNGSDAGGRTDRRSTDVRLEHDPDESSAVDAGSEAAVKGTDDSPEHADEPVAAETDAAASTGSLTGEPGGREESTEPAEATGVTEHAGTETEAAEPAEAAGPTPEEPDVGEALEDTAGAAAASAGDEADEPAGPAADAEPAEGGTAETDDPEATDPGEESVRAISGIGRAYGKRLADAGVETVADLAAADAADLAEASGISEKRIAGWQSSATERLQ